MKIPIMHCGIGTSCIWEMGHLSSRNMFISNGRFYPNRSIYRLQIYHILRKHLRDFIGSFLMRKFSLEIFYIYFLNEAVA